MNYLLWSLIIEVGCSEGFRILFEGDSLRVLFGSMLSLSGWVGRAEPARFLDVFKGDYLTSTIGLGLVFAGWG